MFQKQNIHQNSQVKLAQKLATRKTTPHSGYSYDTTIFGHCYPTIFEDLSCCRNSMSLKVSCLNTACSFSMRLLNNRNMTAK